MYTGYPTISLICDHDYITSHEQKEQIILNRRVYHFAIFATIKQLLIYTE